MLRAAGAYRRGMPSAPLAAPRDAAPGNAPARSSRAEALLALTGSALVLGALAVVWVLTAMADHPLYVSGLGADGEPTAGAFEVALLMVSAGGAAVAWAGRGLRSYAPLLGRWSPSITLAVASAAFLLASQVTCTAGCPVPGTPASTWQDLVHVSSAVLGFAAAVVAMVQTAFAVGARGLPELSLVAGTCVAVVSGAGGILSLVGFATDVGALMEHVATSLALGWLAVLGTVVAARWWPSR